MKIIGKDEFKERVEYVVDHVHSIISSVSNVTTIFKPVIKELTENKILAQNEDETIIPPMMFEAVIFGERMQNNSDAFIWGIEMTKHQVTSTTMTELITKVKAKHDKQINTHFATLIKENNFRIYSTYEYFEKHFFFDLGEDTTQNRKELFFVVGVEFHKAKKEEERKKLENLDEEHKKQLEDINKKLEEVVKRLEPFLRYINEDDDNKLFKQKVYEEFTTPEEWFILVFAAYQNFRGDDGETLLPELIDLHKASEFINKHTDLILTAFEGNEDEDISSYNMLEMISTLLEHFENIEDKRLLISVGALNFLSNAVSNRY